MNFKALVLHCSNQAPFQLVKECFYLTRPGLSRRLYNIYTQRLLTCTKESVAVLPVYGRDAPFDSEVVQTTNYNR